MDLPINYDTSDWSLRRLTRLDYIKKQNGLCCHCGQPLDGDPSTRICNTSINEKLFPPNFFKHLIHLHHNHETGMTIGAVHARCNAYLWQYHME